jgi:Mg2+/Co2+ transporter CorC
VVACSLNGPIHLISARARRHPEQLELLRGDHALELLDAVTALEADDVIAVAALEVADVFEVTTRSSCCC